MTQLILDTAGYNIILPETRKGGYQITEEELSVELEMIAGNIVKELRGDVWRINYQYGYFGEQDKNKLLAACKKGKKTPITCAFLIPTASQLQVSDFFVTAVTPPRFMWSTSQNGILAPVWGDFSFELREVRAHD